MLRLTDIHLSHGGRPVLKGVDLTLREGECLAVVGPNGCGKSTFLRIMAGLEPYEKGRLMKPNRATVGYLPQQANLQVDHSLETELMQAFEEVLEKQEELRRLEEQMAEWQHGQPVDDKVLERYGECSEFIEARGGYDLRPRLARIAAGLGFNQEDLERPCREFSGGWQMRILLGRLLLQKPDVILLDEPTNHLDLETMLWLESWIRRCGQTVVMVSHERAFMDRLVDRVLCLEGGVAELYPGNYTAYLKNSEIRRVERLVAFERQQEEIRSMEAFIRRFRANANRASLVQSRVKQLAKIERLEAPWSPTAIRFRFPKPPPCNQEVAELRQLGHSYDGQHLILSDLNLTIRRGERIGLVGVNGAGKSTLLRILAKRLEPSQGSFELGDKVRMGYFEQYGHSDEESDTNLLEALQAVAPLTEAGRARDVLGTFLFRGDEVEKPVHVLSGGENTRFRLAQLLFGSANLLLLDEPTNHLDISSRSVVEKALTGFQGTVIVVSHDQIFMETVTTRILEITDGDLHDYPGNYSDYLVYKQNFLKENLAAGTASSNPTGARLAVRKLPAKNAPMDKNQRMLERENQKTQERKRKKLEREIAKIEKEIEWQSQRIEKLVLQMAEPAVACDFTKLDPLNQQHRCLNEDHEENIKRWEAMQAEMDSITCR